MLAVYVGCLLFSLVLIGASVLGGSSDHDAHGADHHDADSAETPPAHDDHAEAEAGRSGPWASLRFWSYSLGAFGMLGALLAWLGADSSVHIPVAVGGGFAIGAAVTYTLRALARRSVGSPSDLRDARGLEGVVLLDVQEDKLGKVRVQVGGQDVDLLARPFEESAVLRVGEKVLVVDVESAVARVARTPWLAEGAAQGEIRAADAAPVRTEDPKVR